MEQVGLHFTGENRGALAAARGTKKAISEVTDEAKKSDKQLEKSDRQMKQTTRGVLAGSGAFRSLGRSVAFASASFLGAAGFTLVVRDALDAAVALDDQIDASSVNFGRNAKAVQAWSKTTVTSLGLSERAALEFANQVGRTLKSLDVAPSKTAAWSKELVGLSKDLGELQGKDPAGFIEAFDAAALGRTRGLKQWAISIDDAQISAEALRLGLVRSSADMGKVEVAQQKLAIAEAKLAAAERDHGSRSVAAAQARLTVKAAQDALAKSVDGTVPKLTAAQRAEALYQLVLRKTADAHGYYAKQAGDADVKAEKFRAALENLEAQVGTALLPVLGEAADALGEWLANSENQEKVTEAVTDAVNALKQALDVALPLIEEAWHLADHAAEAVGGWENALKLLVAIKVASWLSGMVTGIEAASLAITGGAAAGGAGGLIGAIARLRAAAALPILITVGAAGSTSQTVGSVPGGPQDVQGGPGMLTAYYDPIDGTHRLVKVRRGETDIQAATRDFNARHPATGPATMPGGGAAGSVFPGGRATGSSVPTTNVLTTPTHDTHGGNLKPAFGVMGTRNLDEMHKAGTIVGAPEDGYVHHLSGKPYTGSAGSGAYGLSLYFVGLETGDIYYMTHFSKIFVSPGDHLRKGAALGVVAFDHIHVELAPPGYTLGTARAGGTTGSSATATSSSPAASSSVDVPSPPASRTDITKLTPALRTQVAKAGDKPAAQLTAQEAILRFYLGRQKRKGLTADEKADLAEAIADTKSKIREINKQIADAVNEEVAKGNRRLRDALEKNPELATTTFASVGATRGGDLIPGLRQATRIMQQRLASALAAARTTMGGGSSVLKTLLGFDQSTRVQVADEYGRAIQMTIGDVVAKATVLLNRLEKAMASGNVKAIRAAVAAWKNFGPELAAAVSAGQDAAAAALQKSQDKLDTALGRVASRILTAFDRTTQRELQAMQRSFQAQVDGLQKDLDTRIAGMQRALQAKIARIQSQGAKLTPEERALGAFDEARTAEQRAADLAEANLIADPVERAKRLHELELAEQRDALQKAAEASRQARDQETADQVQALQDQESALEQSLRDQLAIQIQAMQDAETAREQDYQDQRDAQRTNLADQLDDWKKHLEDGSASWSDFVKWLQGLGTSGLIDVGDIPDPVQAMADAGQAQGSAFAQAYIAELHAAWQAYQDFLAGAEPTYTASAKPSYGSEGGTGHGIGHVGFARGGRAPGQYVGRQDTLFSRLTPGEEVLDRDLSKALRRVFVDGGFTGGGPTVIVKELHTYGGTERQVHEGLSRALRPYTGRVAAYDTVL